jgi:hypothetical protein
VTKMAALQAGADCHLEFRRVQLMASDVPIQECLTAFVRF